MILVRFIFYPSEQSQAPQILMALICIVSKTNKYGLHNDMSNSED